MFNNNTAQTGGPTATNREYESGEKCNESEREENVINHSAKTTLSDEYIQTSQINNELHETLDNNIEKMNSQNKKNQGNYSSGPK